MSDEAELTNNEVGNAWMLHILSKLQTSWPLPINVKLGEVISETGASLGDAQRDVQAFSGLVNWLMHEKLDRKSVV